MASPSALGPRPVEGVSEEQIKLLHGYLDQWGIAPWVGKHSAACRTALDELLSSYERLRAERELAERDCQQAEYESERLADQNGRLDEECSRLDEEIDTLRAERGRYEKALLTIRDETADPDSPSHEVARAALSASAPEPPK